MLVLDEPTTGVDPVSRREFWKLLAEFLSQGLTIVMATPYLDEAERCARVALLSDGRLLALDEPANLQAAMRGRFSRVVATPRAPGAGVLRARSAASACSCSAIACTCGSIARRRARDLTADARASRPRRCEGARDRADARGRVHRASRDRAGGRHLAGRTVHTVSELTEGRLPMRATLTSLTVLTLSLCPASRRHRPRSRFHSRKRFVWESLMSRG